MFGMVLFIYLKIILIFLSLPQSFDFLCCMVLIAKQIGITYCACKDIAAAGKGIFVQAGRSQSALNVVKDELNKMDMYPCI